MNGWKRPDNVPYPSTWATFRGRKFGDDEPNEYIIQDIPEELFEEAVDHMIRYFLVRENICSSIGFLEEEVSVKEMQAFWRTIVKQKMGLIALVKNKKTGKLDIAGVNMTTISEKSDNLDDIIFEGEKLTKIWNCLKDLEAPVDVFEMFKVDAYMTALGLSVAPQYQGDDIGCQLLKARTPLCKATGVKLTITAFTGPASQYLATKTGFKIINELNYETYKQNGKVAFPRLKCKCLLMAKEINENTDS